MECRTTSHNSRDFLSSPLLSLVLFWLPAIAIVASGTNAVGPLWRTVIWTVALSVMGAGCMANAMRCGRVHCYLTGPFFLAMALVTLLYGAGVLPLGANGWNLIGFTILIGAVALCCLPELLVGRYRKGHG